MSIELPQEAEQFVKQQLATGQYADESAVVAEALARWQQQKATEANIRAKVQLGLDDLGRWALPDHKHPRRSKSVW